MTQMSIPEIKVHKTLLTQPHGTHDRPHELLTVQETQHSTGDKLQEGPEEYLAVNQSMDISDRPREMCP
jgi:hypothetical protein